MHETYDEETQPPAASGLVVEVDRGSLPFALIHGDSLVACAAWALGAAGVTSLDLGTSWADTVAADEPLVLHDPLCPMTPPAFIAVCLRLALASGAVVVAVEETTGAVLSPLVLPASVVRALEDLPSTDFAALAQLLTGRFPVRHVVAPAQARRVSSRAEVVELEAATAGSGEPT